MEAWIFPAFDEINVKARMYTLHRAANIDVHVDIYTFLQCIFFLALTFSFLFQSFSCTNACSPVRGLSAKSFVRMSEHR